MKARPKHYKFIIGGVSIALIAVTTAFIMFPVGTAGAYINAGDALVYVCAYMLGGVLGGVCAGLGSALADIMLGVVIYAPASFVIKGLMAIIAWLFMRPPKNKTPLPALAAAGLVMPLGYYLYELFIFGSAAAFAGLMFNLIQYACGVLLGWLAITAVKKVENRL